MTSANYPAIFLYNIFVLPLNMGKKHAGRPKLPKNLKRVQISAKVNQSTHSALMNGKRRLGSIGLAIDELSVIVSGTTFNEKV